MRHFRAAALAALAATCHYLIFESCAVAEENERPSPVTNPHYLIELAPFVRLPAIRRELRVNDVQVFDLAFIEQEAKQRFEKFKEQYIPLATPQERRDRFLQYRADETLFRQFADAVLIPDQLNRLKQLASQYVTRDPGDGFGILGREMKKELGITDEQAKALREKSTAVAEQLQLREAELKLELEKLRAKLRAELVESLDPAQRESLKRLWGDLVPIPQ